MSRRYWIGVACREHVGRGVADTNPDTTGLEPTGDRAGPQIGTGYLIAQVCQHLGNAADAAGSFDFTLAGNINEAQQHLASYLASCQGEDAHQPDLLEQVDCAKCQFNLCRFDDAMATLQQARKQLAAGNGGSDELVLATHLGQMTAQMSEARKRAIDIRKRGIAALHSNNPITAVESLLQAIRLMPSDADSAFQLFMALGQAWPRGYSINQTARLALRLQKVIQMSALTNDAEYHHHCTTLATQLQMPELADTPRSPKATT